MVQSEIGTSIRIVIQKDKSKPVSPRDLSQRLFPLSPRLQECFTDMIEIMWDSGGGFKLRDFLLRFSKSQGSNPRYNNETINTVWKSCLRSGLFKRQKKGAEIHFDSTFSERVRDISDYWGDVIRSTPIPVSIKESKLKEKGPEE